MNAIWHRRHVMPTRPSLAQRVRWHLAHAKACGCREIPRTIAAEITRRDKISTRSRRSLVPATRMCPFDPSRLIVHSLSGLAVSSVEAGAKADLLGDRLALTGAAYAIRRTNVPEAQTSGFYRQIGEGKSRGIEAALHGSLVRGLGVDAGYAWTRTEVTRDVAGFIGRELPNAPRHKANVWVRHRFREGRLDHLTLATGVVHVANRFIGGDNVTIAAAYTRLDAFGSYELVGPRLTLAAAVQNVTNVRYVRSGAGVGLWAGAPRRVAFQVTSSF